MFCVTGDKTVIDVSVLVQCKHCKRSWRRENSFAFLLPQTFSLSLPLPETSDLGGKKRLNPISPVTLKTISYLMFENLREVL